MKNEDRINRVMPDISKDSVTPIGGMIDWVGMEAVDLPLKFMVQEGERSVVAKAKSYVSLDSEKAKGIHMSRLYIDLYNEFSQSVLTVESFQNLLKNFVKSQQGLSLRSRVELSFDLPLRRKALLSESVGWKSYPCTLRGTYANDHFQWELSVTVAYSSTCPCSAALARQLVQRQFEQSFLETETLSKSQILEWLGKESSIVATPHAQRSFAELKVLLANREEEKLWPFEAFIELIEGAVKTPVQTAVKREDEQEFARLNGMNLMFCEDSARRISQALNAEKEIADFYLHVEHAESLHAHNAVSIMTKNIPGGYQA